MQRNRKAVSLIYLACGFITWLIMKEVVASIWAIAHLPLFADWLVDPSEAIAALFGLAVFIILLKNDKVVDFTSDVIVEAQRVVWPERKETVASTGIVAVLVLICSMILLVFDLLWGWLVRLLYQ